MPRGHLADGLVIQQNFRVPDRCAAKRKLFTVKPYIVIRAGAIAQLRDAAIYGNSAFTDPLFDGAPRAVTCACKQFLQPLGRALLAIHDACRILLRVEEKSGAGSANYNER